MLTEQDYKDLVRLARLDCEDKSLVGMLDEFNKILDHVEKIRELNTDSAQDYYTAIDTRNVMRDDRAGATLKPEEISKIAPRWEQDHFVIPRVIETR